MNETEQQRLANLEAEVKELKTIVGGKQNETYYTVKQVAQMLGIGAGGVNDHIRKGNLLAKGRRCKKIAETELNKFINQRKNKI